MSEGKITVGELVAELSKLDPSLLVLCSSDEEGNQISPLWDFSVERWDANEEVVADTPNPNAIILWPSR